MKKKILVTALVLAMVAGMVGTAPAVRSYLTSFNSTYGTAGTALDSCTLCHPGGDTGSLNAYGNAAMNANFNYASIANLDSDGDGFANAAEIAARTFPGDASSRPAAGDTTAPVVTGFAIPTSSTSLTAAITTFTATDSVGVTGYRVTETSAIPAASAAGWTATAPANYTFASAGAKTLYAWAKDAAGNVSAPLSRTTTITLPDTTAPVVSGFAIQTSSTSLTVSITTFTATDSVGVTGYRVTETSAIPLASAAGWTTAAPASYTFASAGAKTLYAWAKDGAGNVSAPLSDTTTITLPDTTAPAVTGFSLPVTSTSLTVSITTFTATDSAGVTGYRVTESSAIPLASAAGWTTAAPANYTFASAGAKTLYAWAKDAAGNVSSPVSDTTTISLPDATAPVVTGFAIPASSTLLTVAISTFTATDSTGVAGYLVTETATIPSASAAGWSANVPASYTFASAGAKTLYAWAKDAAGNVSAPLSDATTISLPDTAFPVVTGFAIPASSTSLTVSIGTFTASDDTGVAGYLVTETSAIPAASSAGWRASVPASYTFTSAGAKTLYAWVKDAAGNVSVPVSDTTTISLPDATAPVVTGFAIPAISTSLTVAITTFTATDNTGVTGYLVTENATIPTASSAGWSTNVPASYTFASAGAKTLYAWVKDAAGNVGGAISGVTITVSDATAPVITGFAIPANSTSLTVAITAFTATDNTGVTGYRVTETPTTPAASAAGWSTAAPASHTFASAGAKTLYAWVKDAAGNIGGAISNTVITISSDSAVPAIVRFEIPSRSSSRTVPIREFTATDDIRVTGYIITNSSYRPRLGASGWRSTPPASYTFGSRTSSGTKRLYAWAKDAAGNISAGVSRVVTLSLRSYDRDDDDDHDEEEDD